MFLFQRVLRRRRAGSAAHTGRIRAMQAPAAERQPCPVPAVPVADAAQAIADRVAALLK